MRSVRGGHRSCRALNLLYAGAGAVHRLIDTLKPIIWGGFIFADIACSLAALTRKWGLRSWRVAADDRVGAECGECARVDCGGAVKEGPQAGSNVREFCSPTARTHLFFMARNAGVHHQTVQALR